MRALLEEDFGSTSSHLVEMEVLSDLPSHIPYLFDYMEPSLHVRSTDQTQSPWLPAVFQVLEPQMSRSLPVVKPSGLGSEGLSRTGSPGGGLQHDVIGQDPLYQSIVMKEKKKVPAASSKPFSCHRYIKKCPKRQWAPSTKQVLKGEDHPVETIPSHMYPANKLTDVTSPTSIIVEDQFFQSSSSSGDGELTCPYVRPPIINTSFSHACSDGSMSSEVAGPSEIGHFDQLIDCLFDESNIMEYETQSFEAWLSEPVEDPFSCKATSQSYTNCRKIMNGPKKGSMIDSKEENLSHIKVHDGHDAAFSQGLIGHNQRQQSKSGLIVQNEGVELPEQHKIGLEDICFYPHSLGQEVNTFNQVSTTLGCKKIYLPGPNIGPYHENTMQNPHTMHDEGSASHTSAHTMHDEGSATHISVAESKHLSRNKDGRQLDVVYKGSSLKCGSSYLGEGINAPQISKSIKMEDTLDEDIGKIGQLWSNPSLAFQHVGVKFGNDYAEIGLVRLLTAGAEAVTAKDMDLASVILVRLRELVSYSGNTMQRIAAYFTHGLQSRIEGTEGVDHEGNIKSQGDILAAFQILHEIFPYIKFGHFTANQAILEAVQGEKRVHIVDFEIMEGIQWPAFMQALVSRNGGPPELHITALCRPYVKHGMAMVQETGKRLSEFASTLRLPFTFSLLKVGSEEGFKSSNLKLVKGEALVVNCMLHLPHMPRRTTVSVASFLQGMRKFSPIVLTLGEEELGCSTTAGASYFSEALHHYHAICDSLEACLPTNVVARMLVERVFMAPRINSAVALWGRSSSPYSEHVTEGISTYKWSTLVRTAGFKSLPLSFYNQSQARLLLGLHKDGFKLEERSHCLVLGWQSKPLFAASVWN